MLFVTNRTPNQSHRSRKNRKLTFDNNNTTVSQHLYFCKRETDGSYKEIMSTGLFGALKALPEKTQVLLYIHGFNNNMEPTIFENAKKLESYINDTSNDLVCVVPIIWPCDDDPAYAFADDYWDDQDAADMSGPSFARLVGKFDSWRRAEAQQIEPCYRRINVLAHSMGNRVLKNALSYWSENHSSSNMPQLFRNTFMIAADVENEVLERTEPGKYIVDASRNVVVYYANDDLAMPASKVANIRNKTLSRRLGMTGPESLNKLPNKVYEVDCDEFNNQMDLKGHSYFLDDGNGNISPIISHMSKAIEVGRVQPNERSWVLA